MSKPHALIIDDNQKNLGVMAQMLQLEGVDSTKVPNPNQLASILDQLAQVDVIFLDLEMPGLDGYAVLELLRANPRFKTAPIVAYTVHVSEVKVAYEHGFDSFIGKPLNSDKFPDQLNRILNGESVWETS
jgi:two-component system, cell cycle response regulator DivK